MHVLYVYIYFIISHFLKIIYRPFKLFIGVEVVKKIHNIIGSYDKNNKDDNIIICLLFIGRLIKNE